MRKKNTKDRSHLFRFDALAERIESRIVFYAVTLVVIFVCEAAFTVYGFLNLDLRDIHESLYLVAYILLGSMCLAALIMALRTIKDRKRYQRIYLIWTYVFDVVMLFFGVLVSYLDFYHHYNTFIVYFTMLMAIPALTLIDPVSYTVMVVVSLVTLQLLCQFQGTVFSSTNYINMLIFALVALMGEIFLYEMSVNNFDSRNKLERYANYDALTGLKNRRNLDHYLQEISTSDKEMTLIMADLNKFKSINDTFGHAIGDDVLSYTGLLFDTMFHDDAYRYGGDEFVVIIPFEEKEAIEKKLSYFNQDIMLHFPGKCLGLSFGLYRFVPKKETRMEDALIHAYEALYKAKKKADHICFHSELEKKGQIVD